MQLPAKLASENNAVSRSRSHDGSITLLSAGPRRVRNRAAILKAQPWEAHASASHRVPALAGQVMVPNSNFTSPALAAAIAIRSARLSETPSRSAMVASITHTGGARRPGRKARDRKMSGFVLAAGIQEFESEDRSQEQYVPMTPLRP